MKSITNECSAAFFNYGKNIDFIFLSQLQSILILKTRSFLLRNEKIFSYIFAAIFYRRFSLAANNLWLILNHIHILIGLCIPMPAVINQGRLWGNIFELFSL
jgi:hypothetical protein